MTISDSVTTTCRSIVNHMARTWQRLPVSARLPEPLPLHVTLHRYEHGAEQDSQAFVTSFEAIDAALNIAADTLTPVIVECGAGAGKTTALRWAARRYAQRILDDEQAPLPVYIDLGDVGTRLPATCLSDIVKAQLHKREPIDYRAAALTQRPILVLLDGLDLLPDAISAGSMIDEAYNYADYGNCRFVLSTRTAETVSHTLNEFGTSLRITLGALDKVARDAWLALQSTARSRARFESLTQDNPTAAALLEVPLLFVMVASACLDDDQDAPPFACDTYPGATGMVDGFMHYAVRRAVRDKHLPDGTCFHEVSATFEGVCLAAAQAGLRDRIPRDKIEALLEESDLPGVDLPHNERRHAWDAAIGIALEAGIVFASSDQAEYAFLHQHFAEYSAARHLARRLAIAAKQGFFEAELFDYITFCDLDVIAVHALAVLSADHATEGLVERVFLFLEPTDPTGACELITQSGMEMTCEFIRPLLSHSGSTVQIAALDALQLTGTKVTTDDLIALLGDDTIRRAGDPLLVRVARDLVALDNEKAIAPLLELIYSSAIARFIRTQVIDLLATIRTERTVEALIALLCDEHAEEAIREHVVPILGAIASTATTRALIAVLDNDDVGGGVTTCVARAVSETHPKKAVAALSTLISNGNCDRARRMEAISLLGTIGCDEAVRTLIDILSDINVAKDARECASRALGFTCSNTAVTGLIHLVSTDQCRSDIRQLAIEVLGHLRSEQAIIALVTLITRARVDDDVRDCAAAALRAIHPDKAVDTLVTYLAPGNTACWIQERVVWALLAIGDERAIAPLVALVGRATCNAHVRACAAYVLGTRRTNGAVTALLTLLGDGHVGEHGWAAAIRALGAIGAEIAYPVIDTIIRERACSDYVLTEAVHALSGIDAERAVPTLVALNNCGDVTDDTRKAIVTALGESRADAAVRALIDIMNNPDIGDDVRDRVLRSRLMLVMPEGLDALITRARSAALTDSQQMSVIDMMCYHGEKSTTNALVALINNNGRLGDEARAYAIYRLGSVTHEAAVDALIRLAGDGSESLPTRESAVVALCESTSSRAVGTLIAWVNKRGLKMETREIIIRALGRFGSEEAIDALSKCATTRTEDARLCLEAIAALCDLASERSVDTLVRLTREGGIGATLRRRVLSTLGEIATPPAIDHLVSWASGEYCVDRHGAIAVLRGVLHADPSRWAAVSNASAFAKMPLTDRVVLARASGRRIVSTSRMSELARQREQRGAYARMRSTNVYVDKRTYVDSVSAQRVQIGDHNIMLDGVDAARREHVSELPPHDACETAIAEKSAASATSGGRPEESLARLKQPFTLNIEYTSETPPARIMENEQNARRYNRGERVDLVDACLPLYIEACEDELSRVSDDTRGRSIRADEVRRAVLDGPIGEPKVAAGPRRKDELLPAKEAAVLSAGGYASRVEREMEQLNLRKEGHKYPSFCPTRVVLNRGELGDAIFEASEIPWQVHRVLLLIAVTCWARRQSDSTGDGADTIHNGDYRAGRTGLKQPCGETRKWLAERFSTKLVEGERTDEPEFVKIKRSWLESMEYGARAKFRFNVKIFVRKPKNEVPSHAS